MKKSYKQLVKDIQQLTATANKIRKAEISRVKKAIKTKMAEYQLSLHDLGAVGAAAYAGARDGMNKAVSSKSRAAKAAKKVKDKRSIVKPKYRHPKSGATWSGRGKTPRWMASELKHGKKRESFLIKK
ncbi:MAG: H-NS histone family protein [Planctomycetes bacterium]|nr:H-NS histone family protein [Planctomycetota bacterium]